MSPWTDDCVDKLKGLHGLGCSASQIAADLGLPFSRNAVIGKLHRLGLSNPMPLVLARRAEKSRKRRGKRKSPNRPMAEPRMPIPFKPRPLSVNADTPPIGARSLLALGPDECRWPYGDRDYVFCGAPTGGKVYCVGHQRLAWRV